MPNPELDDVGHEPGSRSAPDRLTVVDTEADHEAEL